MLVFVDHVENNFNSLLSTYGISCSASGHSLVHYSGKDVFVDITYDQGYSLEVNLFFGQNKIPDDEISFNIGELLRLKSVESKEKYRGFQASTQDSLVYSIKRLADLLEKYGEEILQNQDAIFEELAELRERECNQYADDQELKLIRQDVDLAWKNKDYRKVVTLYKPVDNRIKPSEKKKLEYAKKHMDEFLQ